ncbi:MAG: hypothetical protein ACW9W3_05705 [Candidatus Nitrosopumilus sp. bin_68KS]
MQITIPSEYMRRPNQVTLVGSEAKNPLPTREKMIDYDWIGLSCLVYDDTLDIMLKPIGGGESTK